MTTQRLTPSQFRKSLRMGDVLLLSASLALLACGESAKPAAEASEQDVELSELGLHSAPASSCSVATRAGREYWFCDQKRTWAAARSACQAVGLDLARVNDVAENDFVYTNTLADSWLGGSDLAVEGAWRWGDGAQFWSGGSIGTGVGGLYVKWNFTQPDNFLEQDCLAIEPGSSGVWSDRPCAQLNNFVCEGALAAGDPGITCAPSGPAGAPWPAFGRCSASQAQSNVVAAQSADVIFSKLTSGAVSSSPAVGADGAIYVGSRDGSLYALNLDGTQRWRYVTGGEIWSSPALAPDGTIYVGSNDDYLYALTPAGALKWRFKAAGDVRGAPRIGPDGTVYVGSDDGNMYALTAAGIKKWQSGLVLPVRVAPAIGPDGTIYIGTEASRVYALRADGTAKWYYQTVGPVRGSPSLGADGTVYVTSWDGATHFLNPGTGALKFAYLTLTETFASTAIGTDGSIIVGDTSGAVRALRPDGTLKWQFTAAGPVISTAAVGADGTVYVAGGPRMYALNGATGVERWSYLTGANVESSPAIGASGTVYFGSNDGRVYGLGGAVEPRVTCVSKTGSGGYRALFGYSNALPTSVVVPLGPSNRLTGTPSNPAVQPVTTLLPGKQDQAFWVPFAAGQSVTWTLRGSVVTANQSSPGCKAEAFQPGGADPLLATLVAPPLRASAVKPSRAKLAPLLFDADNERVEFQTATGALLPGEGTTSTRQGVSVTRTTNAAPFKVVITFLRIGQDNAIIGSLDVDSKVVIDGIDQGTHDLFKPSGGIVPPFVDRNDVWTANVASTRTSVPVRIQILERDGNDTDFEVTVDLTVNNRNGTWTGTQSYPTNCHNGGDGWEACWEIVPSGLPTSLPNTRLCSSWNADFVDEGLGESVLGTPRAGRLFKEYPASFAEYTLDISAPRGRAHVGAFYEGADVVALQPAFLDAEGCVPAGVIPPDLLLATKKADGSGTPQSSVSLELQVRSTFSRGTGAQQVRYDVSENVVAGGAQGASNHMTVRARSPQQITLTGYDTASSGVWSIPPTELRSRGEVVSRLSHGGAVISRLLAAPDMGILPGVYQMRVNSGANIEGKLNSAVSGGILMIAPALLPDNAQSCTTTSQCPSVQECLPDANGALMCHWPDQVRWKYIIGHEAGHQVQGRAMGQIAGGEYGFKCPTGGCQGVTTTYYGAPQMIDPEGVGDLCGCQHVEAANGLHCLQSLEISNEAHGEGYGQFYASKLWNKREDATCTFAYYKELLLPQATDCTNAADCRPFRDGQTVQLPPVAVSCKEPRRAVNGTTGWRRNFCPVSDTAEMATERDMMGFLWNINSAPSAQQTTVDQLFDIYKRACGNRLCKSEDKIGWEPRMVGTTELPGFRKGAESLHTLGSARLNFLNEQAGIFSVRPAL